MSAIVKEPYVAAQVVDASQVTKVVPRQPFKIVSLVDSPKGPITPVDCDGRADFLETFVGRSPVAQDHTTIHHVCRLFNTARQTIVRVDGSKVLAGLDNDGATVYTTPEGNVIHDLTQVDLTKVPDIKVVYLQDGTSVFYAGDITAIPDSLEDLTKVEISNEPNVDVLIKYFNTSDKSTTFFGVNNLSEKAFPDVGADLTGSTRLKLRGAFNRLKVKDFNRVMEEGRFITIGSKDYYVYINGLLDQEYDNTPEKIQVPNSASPKFYQYLGILYDKLLSDLGNKFRGTDMTIQEVFPDGNEIIVSDSFKSGFSVAGTALTAYPSREKTTGYVIINQTGIKKILVFCGTLAELGLVQGDYDEVINLSPNALTPLAFAVMMETSTITVPPTSSVTGQYFFFKKTDEIALSTDLPATALEITKDTSTDIMYEYVFPADATYKLNKTYADLSIKIDEFVFYSGTYTPEGGETLIRVGGALTTLSDFLENVNKVLTSYFDASLTEFGFILSGDHEVTGCTNIAVDVNPIIQEFSTRMAIIPGYSSTEPWLKYLVSPSALDPEIYDLTILTTSGKELNYQFSFNSEKVNGSGISVYYEKLNSSQKDFKLISLNSEALLGSYESRFFGSDVTPPPASIDDFISVVESLKNIEDLYPNVLFDGGVMDAKLYKAMIAESVELNCQVFCGNPGETEQEIADFRDACGESWRGYMVGPVHLDSGVGDFAVPIGAHTYVLEQIWNGVASVSDEFVPRVGKVKGIVTPGGIPKASLDKPIRERLLAKQVNMIVWSPFYEVWYLNNNLTMQRAESQLSEEQTARQSLLANQVLQQYMDTQIGEFNTPDWRSKVVQEASRLIDGRLLENHLYRMNDYVLICDGSNNPAWLIDQRKAKLDMRSQFQRSGIYFDIVNKIYGLEGSIRPAE